MCDAQVLWSLLRDLDNLNPGPQILKHNSPKKFGEEVRKLVLHVDVVSLQYHIFKASPYVLDAIMEDGVLFQGQSGILVHLNINCFIASAK